MKPVFFSLFAVFLLTSLPAAAHAQPSNNQFKPGQWQITSTVTPSMGKTVHRQLSVCAKSATETWRPDSANKECTTPTVKTITNGYNIKLNCKGDTGPVKWVSVTSVNETFSEGGTAFEATGATNTTVSYAGHAPIKSSATLHATGKRTGACK